MHPAKPAAHQGPTGHDFSQTLAQSLATPAQSAAQRPETARTGKATKPHAGHGTGKVHRPDPVGAAMAMMNQSPPSAPVPAATHGDAAKRPGAARPSALEPTAHRTHKGPRTAPQATLLAKASGKDAPAAQGTTRQGDNAAPAGPAAPGSAAVALGAGQLASGTHAAAQSPASAASAALSAPVGTSAWRGQLGAQLTWMARQGLQSASLQVSPQHLGPVHVSISVHHGQASVWFGAAEAQTRQALTQALPELRAMFATQGLALTDSGVSHDAPRDGRRTARPAVGAIGAVGEVGEVGGSQGGADGALGGVGLIDTYA